jgi:hypothetical protein
MSHHRCSAQVTRPGAGPQSPGAGVQEGEDAA